MYVDMWICKDARSSSVEQEIVHRGSMYVQYFGQTYALSSCLFKVDHKLNM